MSQPDPQWCPTLIGKSSPPWGTVVNQKGSRQAVELGREKDRKVEWLGKTLLSLQLTNVSRLYCQEETLVVMFFV
ncbi:hypothetical protein PsAD37_03521 [Pseudovibrio sp. Ad37]|nr:hypothetical protein PsAD37_03521 [Pseudovibrio sp. Ad37]